MSCTRADHGQGMSTEITDSNHFREERYGMGRKFRERESSGDGDILSGAVVWLMRRMRNGEMQKERGNSCAQLLTR